MTYDFVKPLSSEESNNIIIIIYYYYYIIIIVYTSFNIGKYVYCNCLFLRLQRPKFWH